VPTSFQIQAEATPNCPEGHPRKTNPTRQFSSVDCRRKTNPMARWVVCADGPDNLLSGRRSRKRPGDRRTPAEWPAHAPGSVGGPDNIVVRAAQPQEARRQADAFRMAFASARPLVASRPGQQVVRATRKIPLHPFGDRSRVRGSCSRIGGWPGQLVVQEATRARRTQFGNFRALTLGAKRTQWRAGSFARPLTPLKAGVVCKDFDFRARSDPKPRSPNGPNGALGEKWPFRAARGSLRIPSTKADPFPARKDGCRGAKRTQLGSGRTRG